MAVKGQSADGLVARENELIRHWAANRFGHFWGRTLFGQILFGFGYISMCSRTYIEMYEWDLTKPYRSATPPNFLRCILCT